MINEPSNIIAITRQNACYRWLGGLEERLMNFIFVEPDQPQRITDLINSVKVSAMIVYLPEIDGSSDLTDQQALKDMMELIESLSMQFPMIPIVAASEVITQVLLLPAMRAGARDFIQVGQATNDTYAQLARYAQPREVDAKGQAQEKGNIFLLLNARVSDGSTLLASHLALALQRLGSTLLVDLGKPHADSLYILGVSPKFSFYDALTNSRRLDNTLIQTGIARHKSGLAVLTLPEDGEAPDIRAAEMYLVIDTLRKHFDHLVFNLGGHESLEVPTLMAPLANKSLILVEQSIPSCKKNYEMIERLRSVKQLNQHCGLVIDRHLPKHKPSASDIAQSFDLPVYATLPSCGMSRLAAYNIGESLSEIAPNNPYSKTVEQLAYALLDIKQPQGWRWLSQIKALLGRDAARTYANADEVFNK